MRFIKKNGRIIPIREKKELTSDDHFRHAGTAVGGVVIGTAISPALYRASTRPDHRKWNVEPYRAEFRKAGSPNVMRQKGRGAMSYFLGIPHTNIKRRTITMGEGTSEATFLHELGHLRSARRAGTMNRLYRKVGINLSRHGLKAVPKSLPLTMARPWTDLVAEAEATGEAIRMAKNAHGWRKAGQVGRKLALPYLSYVNRAGVYTALGYAGYKVARAIHSAIKEEKKGK